MKETQHVGACAAPSLLDIVVSAARARRRSVDPHRGGASRDHVAAPEFDLVVLRGQPPPDPRPNLLPH